MTILGCTLAEATARNRGVCDLHFNTKYVVSNQRRKILIGLAVPEVPANNDDVDVVIIRRRSRPSSPVRQQKQRDPGAVSLAMKDVGCDKVEPIPVDDSDYEKCTSPTAVVTNKGQIDDIDDESSETEIPDKSDCVANGTTTKSLAQIPAESSSSHTGLTSDNITMAAFTTRLRLNPDAPASFSGNRSEIITKTQPTSLDRQTPRHTSTTGDEDCDDDDDDDNRNQSYNGMRIASPCSIINKSDNKKVQCRLQPKKDVDSSHAEPLLDDDVPDAKRLRLVNAALSKLKSKHLIINKVASSLASGMPQPQAPDDTKRTPIVSSVVSSRSKGTKFANVL